MARQGLDAALARAFRPCHPFDLMPRAGLIPKLCRRRPPNETWDVAVFTPGERPWSRLAEALEPLRFPDKSDTELDIEIDKHRRFGSIDRESNFLVDSVADEDGMVSVLSDKEGIKQEQADAGALAGIRRSAAARHAHQGIS